MAARGTDEKAMTDADGAGITAMAAMMSCTPCGASQSMRQDAFDAA
jgi:hypothetical protein